MSPGRATATRLEGGAASPLIRELAGRWKRARCEALRTLVPAADPGPDFDEAALVASAHVVDAEAARKRVFENSRILGRGFSRYHGVDLTLVDVAGVLAGLGAPCHSLGVHRTADEPACRSERAPCALVGTSWCDHWRESTLGMVGGLSSTVYYTRVESPAAGGGACVDLLHTNPQTTKRFTPIAGELQLGLDAISRMIGCFDPGAKVQFFGLVEGTLHYRVEASPRSSSSTCGSCETQGCSIDPAALAARALHHKFPGLCVADASPRPVISV